MSKIIIAIFFVPIITIALSVIFPIFYLPLFRLGALLNNIFRKDSFPIDGDTKKKIDTIVGSLSFISIIAILFLVISWLLRIDLIILPSSTIAFITLASQFLTYIIIGYLFSESEGVIFPEEACSGECDSDSDDSHKKITQPEKSDLVRKKYGRFIWNLYNFVNLLGCLGILLLSPLFLLFGLISSWFDREK